MGQKNWKKIDERVVYSGYRKMLRRRFVMPNNKEEDYDIVSGSDAVNIFCVTEKNKVVLIEQFRPGPEKVLRITPGGLLGESEKPLDAAKRELLEETGYIGEFVYLGSYLTWAYSTEKVYCFIATNCKKKKNSNHSTDPNEFINIVEIPLTKLKEEIKKGKIARTNDLLSVYMGLEYLSLI